MTINHCLDKLNGWLHRRRVFFARTTAASARRRCGRSMVPIAKGDWREFAFETRWNRPQEGDLSTEVLLHLFAGSWHEAQSVSFIVLIVLSLFSKLILRCVRFAILVRVIENSDSVSSWKSLGLKDIKNFMIMISLFVPNCQFVL